MKKYGIFSNLKMIMNSLSAHSSHMKLYFGMQILTGILFPLLGVYIPGRIVTILENGEGIGSLAMNCVVLFLLYGLFAFVKDYFQEYNHFDVIWSRLSGMNIEFEEACMHMDFETYEKTESQVLLNKANLGVYRGDYYGISGFVFDFRDTLINLGGLLLYLLLVSGLTWWLGAILLGLSFVQYGVYCWAKRYEARNKDAQSYLNRQLNYLSHLSSRVDVGKDVRLYHLKDWVNQCYQQTLKKYQIGATRERSHYFVYDLVCIFVEGLRDGVCYLYLIYLSTQGFDVGSFIFFIGLVRGFGSWFTQLSDALAKLSRDQLIVQDYRHFLDEAVKPNIFFGSGSLEDVPVSIRFDHVSFRYHEDERWILDDVSFSVKAGERLALVGLNGAGKTTLVKLACGLYTPTKGMIYLNDKPMSDYSQEAIFEKTAALFQDSFLLALTIEENVALQTRETMDHDRVMDCLNRAGLAPVIARLPQKEKTYLFKDIQKDGVQLSGGQRQSLLLARALYKNPRFLILDEPTAALDALAENEMYEKYASLTRDCTTIFISHRLASTRFCEDIFYLENGKIIESGSHDELMAKQGAYAHLFEVQSHYYEEGETDETAML